MKKQTVFLILPVLLILLVGCQEKFLSRTLSHDYQKVVFELNRMYDAENFKERGVQVNGVIVPDLIFGIGLFKPIIFKDEIEKGQKYRITIWEAPKKIQYKTRIWVINQNPQVLLKIQSIKDDSLAFYPRLERIESKRLDEILQQLGEKD